MRGLRPLCAGVAAAAAIAAVPNAASATPQRFVLSPGGSDANPGTAALPWRTIAHAGSHATPGSVVDVRAGTYREVVDIGVSGRPGAPITFRAHPGEHVTISGRGLGPFSDHRPLIGIRDHSYLRVKGFELKHLVDLTDKSVPIGVFVTGHAHNITLAHLDVHGIRTGG